MRRVEFLDITEGEALRPGVVEWDSPNAARSFTELEHIVQYRWFRSVIDAASVRGDLLDAACGNGYGTDHLSRSPHVTRAVGADVNLRHLANARRDFPHLEIREQDVEHLSEAFNARRFAFVTSGQTLEHLMDPVSFVRGVADVLRDDGVFMVMSPTHDQEPIGLKPANPWHIFEYDPETLAHLLGFFFADVRMGDDRPCNEMFDTIRRLGEEFQVPSAEAVFCAAPRRSYSEVQYDAFRSDFLLNIYKQIIRQTQDRMVETRRSTNFLRDSFHLIDFERGFFVPEVSKVWTEPEAEFRVTPDGRPVELRFNTGRELRFFDLTWDGGKQSCFGSASVIFEEPASVRISAEPFVPGSPDIRTLGVALTMVREV